MKNIVLNWHHDDLLSDSSVIIGLWNQDAIHTDFSYFFRAAESRQL